MTNQEIIEAGQLIHDEEAVGGNTSERVGGAIKGIGQNLEEQDENIDDVNRRLANEADTRANEDTSIRQALQLETTTRIEKDAQEKINRQDADAALQEAIDDEETARQTADTSLQEAIDDEATARAAAVQAERGLREDADATLLGMIRAVTLSLANYYLKTETYNKTEVNALIDAINSFEYVVVPQLPSPSAETMNKIYLVPSPHSEDENVKDEFITTKTGGTYDWEQIGSTAVDLSGYSTTAEMTVAINGALATALAGYYTKQEVAQLLTSKQDVIEDLQQIRTGAAAGATALQEEDIEAMTEETPTSESTKLMSSGGVYTANLKGSKRLYKGVMLLENHLVNHNAQGHELIESANWDTLIIEIPHGAKSLTIDGAVMTSGNFTADVWPDDTFSLWSGSHYVGSDLSKLDTPAYAAGKYISVSLRKESQTVAYEDMMPNWTFTEGLSADDVPLPSSDRAARSGSVFDLSAKDYVSTPLSAISYAGRYDSSGIWDNTGGQWYSYEFEVEEGKAYHVCVHGYSNYSVMLCRWSTEYVGESTPPSRRTVIDIPESVLGDKQVAEFDATAPAGARALVVTYRLNRRPVPTVDEIEVTVVPVKDYAGPLIGHVSSNLAKKTLSESDPIEATKISGYYRADGTYQTGSYETYDFPVEGGKRYHVHIPPFSQSSDTMLCKWSLGYDVDGQGNPTTGTREMVPCEASNIVSQNSFSPDFDMILEAPANAKLLTVLYRPNYYYVPVVTELSEADVAVDDAISSTATRLSAKLNRNSKPIAALEKHNPGFGGYYRPTNTFSSSSAYCHYIFPVTAGKKYSIYLPWWAQSSALSSSAFWVAAGTKYTASDEKRLFDRLFGIAIPESAVPAGGKVVCMELVAPSNAVALHVMSRSGVSATDSSVIYATAEPPVVEELLDEPISVNDYVDELLGNNKRMKVRVVKGDNFFVRTRYDADRDLMIHIGRKGQSDNGTESNNNITANKTWLGSNQLTDDELTSDEHLIHFWEDSTAPIYNSSGSPWHYFSQHGYFVPCIQATGHGLTSADIGSTWKWVDGNNVSHNFVVGRIISVNAIVLLPEMTLDIGGIKGNNARSWERDTWDGKFPVTLTRVSYGSGVQSITATKYYYANYQLKPIQEVESRTILIDGVPVTEDGVYYADDLVVSETLIGLNPWKVRNWFDANGKCSPVKGNEDGEMVHFSQLFHVHGMSIRYDTVLDVRYPTRFDLYGANQAQHNESKDGYEIYVFVPRAIAPTGQAAVDVPFLNRPKESGEQGYDQRSVLVYRQTSPESGKAACYDVDKMPDRCVSYLQSKTDASDKLIGFASGVSLTRGATVDSERVNLINSGRMCMNVSASQNNKMYIIAVEKDTYANGLLPDTFCKSFSTYFCYYDPKANAGQVYWYKDGNGYVVYAHSQTAAAKRALVLEKDMEGMSVEVVDATEGMSLLTDMVVNGKVYVSADSAQNNYIVLKVKG